jgi:hypothetical protein
MFQPDRPAPTGSTSSLAEWCLRQFLKVAEAMRSAVERLPMKYLATLPSKPKDGLYLFASNVVSASAARGLYRYDEATAAYSLVLGLSSSGTITLPSSTTAGIQVDLASPAYTWRDIIGNVEPKATGAGSPTRSSYAGGNLGAYSFIANDVCDFVFHIPHDYVIGTDVYFHVHWSHTGTTTSGNAVFDIYHDYAKGHNQANFPAEKNVTITYDTVDITTTPRYRHRVDEVIISGASATASLMDRDDIEPDGLLRVTLKLTTLPTLGGGGKLFIDTCDIHYQSSNIGTRISTPKNVEAHFLGRTP